MRHDRGGGGRGGAVGGAGAVRDGGGGGRGPGPPRVPGARAEQLTPGLVVPADPRRAQPRACSPGSPGSAKEGSETRTPGV